MIETDRLILRQWTDSDRAPFAEMNANPVVMEFFPSTLDEASSNEFVDKHSAAIESTGIGMFCAEEKATGAFVGYVGIYSHSATPVPPLSSRASRDPVSNCVEIGWRLLPEFWGKGLATEAAIGVLKYAFETLGLEEIVSFTAVINERSSRVMERLHMKRDVETFEHPSVETGHALREHVNYRITREEFKAYEAVAASGFELPRGWVELGRFGDSKEMSDRLLVPIKSGLKTATSSLLWEYESDNEPLPEVGDYEIVMNSADEPAFVIRYTEIVTMPFNEVSSDYARDEGEGDLSLEYWRRVHWDFFTKVCSWIDRAPSQTMPVVCTRFIVEWRVASNK